MDEATARSYQPKIAIMNELNQIEMLIGEEIHGTVL
jgi:aspartate 1-decarboxylase